MNFFAIGHFGENVLWKKLMIGENIHGKINTLGEKSLENVGPYHIWKNSSIC